MMSGTEFSGLASELTMFTSGGGGGDVSSNTDKTASYNDKSYGDSFSGGGDVSSNTDKTASYNDKSYGDSFSGGGEKTTNFFSCKSPSK
jgi:hypothetical protein